MDKENLNLLEIEYLRCLQCDSIQNHGLGFIGDVFVFQCIACGDLFFSDGFSIPRSKPVRKKPEYIDWLLKIKLPKIDIKGKNWFCSHISYNQSFL